MTSAPSSPVATDAGMARLGTLLLESGHSVTDTRITLEQVQEAVQPTIERRFAVLPEVVFAGPSDAAATMRVAEMPPLSIRQAAEVNRVVRALRLGSLTFGEAMARADEIRLADPGKRTLRWIVGSALIAVGLALLFHCPWWTIVFSALTGLLVGAVTVALDRLGTASATSPFIASFLSTTLVGAAANWWEIGSVPLFAVCAPVAILVPGGLITNALLELTASDIVTGAGRLISGIVILGFMAAGIFAGAALTGLATDPGSASLIGETPDTTWLDQGWLTIPPTWTAWFGVLALAVGIAYAFGAGHALTWVAIGAMAAAYLLLTVLTPYTGSIAATGITGAVLFIMARLLEQTPSGIPSSVSFMPAFLLLVPGTIGLVALTSSDPAGLSSTPLTFVSLCVGTKLGSAVSELVRPRHVPSTTGVIRAVKPRKRRTPKWRRTLP